MCYVMISQLPAGFLFARPRLELGLVRGLHGTYHTSALADSCQSFFFGGADHDSHYEWLCC